MTPGRIHRTIIGKRYAETGEVRCPITGEYYLSPSEVVHYAAVDFVAPWAHPIVREVEVDVPATYKFKET